MKGPCLLIRPKFLGFRNTVLRSDGGRRKKLLILVGLGLVFCGGMFIGSCRALIHFRSAEIIGDLLAHHFLGMIFLVFFSMLIFSHVLAALSNLYLSKDLELCHSLPVTLEEIFVSRAAYTFMDSSWMLLVFGLPVFLAYAYVYHPGPGFYFTLLHMNLAMAIIAAGIGILVTMFLVYIFPAQRTRDIIMILSILMIVALYVLFRFLRPERLVNPDSFLTVMQYINALKAPQSPYLPNQWITETLWDSLTGNNTKGRLFEVMLTWSTATAIAVINMWVANAIYFKGFSKAQESKRRRWGSGLLDLTATFTTRPFGRDMAAVLTKDIREFFRNNAQWSQVLLLGAIIVVYVYNFTVLPLEKSPIRLDFLQNQLAFLNMGLAGFVLSAVCVRFIYTAVSTEGEAYWILRSSPLGLKRYLWGKYLFSLIPLLILAEVLIIATNYFLHVTPFMMVLSSCTMFFMVLGITALGVGIGAIYPDFRCENIVRVSTGFGGVLYMIISSLFVGTVVVLEAGPVYILFMANLHEKAVTSSQWLFIGISFLLVLVINILAIIKPMQMGLKALEAAEV